MFLTLSPSLPPDSYNSVKQFLVTDYSSPQRRSSFSFFLGCVLDKRVGGLSKSILKFQGSALTILGMMFFSFS
jgi:hypothetical protein